MRMIFKVSLVVLVVAALAWASAPWDGKPYQQWTQKEVMQVLNDSPWVKMTSVLATWSRPSSNGNEEGGGRGRGGRGRSMEESRNQDMFEARWVSAKVVREALVRLNILSGKMTQADADKAVAQEFPIYELVLFGQDMSPLAKMSDADVAKAASLKMKNSKLQVTATEAKIERDANGRVTAVLFAFPRTVNGKPVIGPQEKGFDFALNAGKLRVSLQFDPRKMTTKDGLDL
jgi:hypothetical protein